MEVIEEKKEEIKEVVEAVLEEKKEEIKEVVEDVAKKVDDAADAVCEKVEAVAEKALEKLEDSIPGATKLVEVVDAAFAGVACSCGLLGWQFSARKVPSK